MRLSGPAFSIGFILCYVLMLSLELPVLGYYPLTGDWSFQDLSAQAGTVMHWYGLILTAVLAGLFTAMAVALLGLLLPHIGIKFERQLAGLGLISAWLGMTVCAGLLGQYFA